MRSCSVRLRHHCGPRADRWNDRAGARNRSGRRGHEDRQGRLQPFVIGGTGLDTREAVKALLAKEARRRSSPPDWVYVNNFAKPDKPIAIKLPTGRAIGLKEAMHKLIDDLKTAAPAASSYCDLIPIIVASSDQR